jgi:hypothetical protein
VLDKKFVWVKDGPAVAVKVITIVVKPIRVDSFVSVVTRKEVLGVNAVLVITRVEVLVVTVHRVFVRCRVVESVLVDGVKVVITDVVVLTIVLVVVVKSVCTLVVVRMIVEKVVVTLVVNRILVIVLVLPTTLVNVNRSVVDIMRVLAVGKVTTKLAVFVLVVTQVLVTVVVTLRKTVVTSSHWGRICLVNKASRSQNIFRFILMSIVSWIYI